MLIIVYHLVDHKCAEETLLIFIELTFVFKAAVHNNEKKN